MIDIEKAFDSVWIYGLLLVLQKLGFAKDFIPLVWSMTRNRFLVTWNGIETSIVFNVVEGLMQGAVCSPALFNIFTHNVL